MSHLNKASTHALRAALIIFILLWSIYLLVSEFSLDILTFISRW